MIAASQTYNIKRTSLQDYYLAEIKTKIVKSFSSFVLIHASMNRNRRAPSFSVLYVKRLSGFCRAACFLTNKRKYAHYAQSEVRQNVRYIRFQTAEVTIDCAICSIDSDLPSN